MSHFAIIPNLLTIVIRNLFQMTSELKSCIWNYFEIDVVENHIAHCIVCKQILVRGNSLKPNCIINFDN